MKKSTGAILIIIIVVLLGVIGVGGYFFIKGNIDTNKEIGELKNEIVNLGNEIKSTSNSITTNAVQTNTNTTTTSTENKNTSSTSTEEQIKNAYAKKIGQNSNVVEYTINSVKILSAEETKYLFEEYDSQHNIFKENDILAYVGFSVKLKDPQGELSAGNGTPDGDWIKNKQACVIYRNGEIVSDGTGW